MSNILKFPILDKESTNGYNESIVFCTTSMQGWRINQEDAFNAILNYDTKTSFFGVYDGHGGCEVAQYCAKYLPDTLKRLNDYTCGNIENALKKLFLKVDKSLRRPSVLQELIEIRDTALLRAEATMPIKKLLRKYGDYQNRVARDTKAQILASASASAAKPGALAEETKCEYDSAFDSDDADDANYESEDEEEPDDEAEYATDFEDDDCDHNDTSGNESETERSAVDCKATYIKLLSNLKPIGKAVDVAYNTDESYDDVFYRRPGLFSGCVTIVALLRDNKLYVANAGDARCVVCRNGKAISMSMDHKPTVPSERDRIVRAGYEVISRRVDNNLSLSRAIGDHQYKDNKRLPLSEQAVTALPDVSSLDIDPNTDQFMVLACDGIWERKSSQEVCDFIRKYLDILDKFALKPSNMSMLLTEYSRLLVDECCAKSEPYFYDEDEDDDQEFTGYDNMTCIIVLFKPSPTTADTATAIGKYTRVTRKASNAKPKSCHNKRHVSSNK